MQKISITDEESHRQVESSQTHYCLMWAPHTSLTIHTHIFTYGQSHACEQPHPVSGVYFVHLRLCVLAQCVPYTIWKLGRRLVLAIG